jgi:hypothetical protein
MTLEEMISKVVHEWESWDDDTADVVMKAIRAAVLLEREECAKLADAERQYYDEFHGEGDRACRDIGKAIRARP